MKYFVLALLLMVSLSIFSQRKKVNVQYGQEDVLVLVDGTMMGENPNSLKIDPQLNRKIFFYKNGYYSQTINLDPDAAIDDLSINLIKNSENTKLSYKQLLKPDTLVISKTVSNFTRSDIREVIGRNFMNNNFVIGKETQLFANLDSDIKDTKYKIAAEVYDNTQIRSFYSKPRFLAAHIKVRWYLLDISKNKVVFSSETEGMHVITSNKTKGYVVSELMKKAMTEAIEEAQDRLITDDHFLAILKEN